MITRTIKATTVHALCINYTNKSTEEKDFTLSHCPADDEKALVAICKMLATNGDTNVRPVCVLSRTETTAKYGMTESNFLALAKVITNEDEAEG